MRGRIVLLVGVALVAVVAFACQTPASESASDALKPVAESGDEVSSSDTTKTGLPCEVSSVLSKHCSSCHGAETKAGASTSLVTWDDLQKTHAGKTVTELVKARIHAEEGRMPPAARLSDAEIEAIDTWIDGGAKKSDASCEGAPTAVARPYSCASPAKTTELKPSKPFVWQGDASDDQYVCFGFDEPVAKKRHAITFGPRIDNPNIVHHVLIFQSDSSVSPDPHPCAAIAAASWGMIAGWAPGGGVFELPPQAGFPVEDTTHWVVQVHYNNAKSLQDQQDQSGYQICETEDLRPNDAGMLAFGTRRFSIPPRTAAFTQRCDYELPKRYEGVKFFSVIPHMHKLGTYVGSERLPGGKETQREMIFEQNPYNFENQANFPLDHVSVEPGDVIRTRCTWKNPGDRRVTWGEDTSDEMCFNLIAYYPRIPDKTIGPVPFQSWVTPSIDIPGLGGPKCTDE